MIGVGTMRSSIVMALATVTLAACATAQPQDQASSAQMQSTVYVVGEQAAAVQAAMTTPVANKKSDATALKRVYWFLAGR